MPPVSPSRRHLQWVRLPIEVQKHWLAHLVAKTSAGSDRPRAERCQAHSRLRSALEEHRHVGRQGITQRLFQVLVDLPAQPPLD